MVNNSLENKGVTKEAAEYCFRSIIQLMNGNTKKFEEYAAKAIDINNEIEEKVNWTNCTFKVNGKKVKAKINMKTQEIRDLEGNVLRSGV
ncbi:hypothetical protein [uncultured Clostridium sp.]|jgi:hypothetical protein|uniref:hypothetical protein n=1 Tax=uncultured Clostridium sp. TaxID=59620 RepID=UPI0025D9B8A6|nr:hypothetical protein [uncultured Clostridium sp.]MDU2291930.1 hypothetical protein [Clostridium celatum]